MIRWILAMCLATVPLGAQSSGDLRAEFDKLAKANPQHMQLLTLPGSISAYAAVLRDTSSTDTRPAVLILGSVHGVETAPGAACLDLARRVLGDEKSRTLLSTTELIIIPTPNPEARDLRFAKLPNAVPGVLMPFDDDRDGKFDEDGPSDLNGDGVISQLRVKRAGGRYVESKLDPRILVETKAGEAGQWDIYWEGADDDGDGHINEDARGTVTLGNDWSVRWSKKQVGANRMMMQLAETRALAEFISPRRNIVAALQIRSIGDGLSFASGPKAKAEDPYERDKQMNDAMRKLWKSAAGEADPKALKSAAEGAGSVIDWLYEAQGVHAANLFLHALSGPKPEKREEKEEDDAGEEEEPKPKKEKPSEAELLQQAWLNYSPDAYLTWKGFKHPQLGDVEIGGWKNTARLDPTAEDAAVGTSRAFEFVKSLMDSLPKLEVSNVEVEDKGEGLYRVRLTLRNAGSLDYRTSFSEKHNIHMPLFVNVSDTKAVELISGTRRVRVENLQNDATTTYEWLVRADVKGDELNFSIESDRCGNLSHKVAIKDCPAIKTEEE